MSENILLSWSFNVKKQRSNLWYTIMFSIAIGLIIWGFLSKQYGMSIVIIIFIGFAFFVENNSSEIIAVNILDKGIRVADSFYSFSNIMYFAIIYEGEHPILLRLKIGKKIGSVNIDIDINNTLSEQARTILLNYIKENKKEELSFIDKMMRILKI